MTYTYSLGDQVWDTPTYSQKDCDARANEEYFAAINREEVGKYCERKARH